MVGFVSGYSIQFPDLNFCGWVGGLSVWLYSKLSTGVMMHPKSLLIHDCCGASVHLTLGLVFLSREEWNCNCYALPCIQCIIHDTAVFTVLILPLYEHRRTFHILMSSPISFFNVPSFYYKLCLCPGIYILVILVRFLLLPNLFLSKLVTGV